MRKGLLAVGIFVGAVGILVLLPFSGVVRGYLSNPNDREGLTVFSVFIQMSFLEAVLGMVPGLLIASIGVFTIFGARSPKVPKDVTSMLGPNEKIQAYVQQLNFRPKISTDSWVLTNERIIHRHPHDMNLEKEYLNFSYADITGSKLDQGIFRSTVTCERRQTPSSLRSPNEADVKLNKLSKLDARRADGVIRENIVRFRTPFSSEQVPDTGFRGQSAQPK